MSLASRSAAGYRTGSPVNMLEILGHAGVSLALAVSGIVYFEPAPYDMAMPFVMLVMLMAGMRFPVQAVPLITLLAVFLAGGFLSALLARHGMNPPLRHFAITSYLAATAVFFAAYVAPAPAMRVERVFKAWCLAALVAAIAAIAAYFGLIDFLEGLVLNERARGTFKDPNVLGPFLVAPTLYACMHILAGRLPRVILWAAFAAIMAGAILLTFSRGAWGHFLLSGIVLIYLLLITSRDMRDRFRLVMMSAIGLLLLAALVAAAMSVEAISDLFEQRASLTQSYDTGVTGRFGRQIAAIGLILDNPAGIGFGEFERIFPEAPHNVYLNAFVIAGWAGGFAYLGLVVSTLVIGFRHALMRTPWQPYSLIVYATFVGMAAEGAVIDSDHWRHFYLLTGLMWGLFVADWRLGAQSRRGRLNGLAAAAGNRPDI